MNKTIQLFLLLSLANNCLSQESIFFNIAIQPNSEYIESTTIISESFVETELVDKNLDVTGIEIPKIKETKSTTTTLSHIRSFNRDTIKQQEFPIEIEYIYYDPGVGRNAIPSGTIIYARGVEKGIYQLDSVVGENLIPLLKKELLNSMDNFFKQYCFPSGKNMKIGDSYSHDFSLKQEISKLPVSAVGRTTYTLTEVKGGKAYFSLTSQIQFIQKKMTPKDFKDKFDFLDYNSIMEDPSTLFLKTGSSLGGGNLVYNIRNKMVENQSIYSIVEMTLENQYIKIKNNQYIDLQLVHEVISTEQDK